MNAISQVTYSISESSQLDFCCRVLAKLKEINLQIFTTISFIVRGRKHKEQIIIFAILMYKLNQIISIIYLCFDSTTKKKVVRNIINNLSHYQMPYKLEFVPNNAFV